ncbi:MAG: hypothetical protein LIO69_01465 [Oscillospiraceae bacterium]|nr:hypothetical protein [Oscillospiraceae bacterium]
MNKSILIKPFEGVGDFTLKSSYKNTLAALKSEKINYTVEVWPNKGCTPEVAWKIVHIENSLNLFFAKDKLFKIYIDGTFNGTLPNGIKIGMTMSEAQCIDSSLLYDDWNEDWSSENGYWLEDDIDSNTVMSITIFIRELLDDDVFDRYEW